MNDKTPHYGTDVAFVVLALGVALFMIIVSGLIQTRDARLNPTPTLTPLPARTDTPTATADQPARNTAAPPTYTPPAPVTRAPVLATSTPDLAMTEVYKGIEQGILVLPMAEETASTPAPASHYLATPGNFPICNPNYAAVCLPAVLTRAYCYDLVERNILVIGEDDLGIDRNNNGIACEDGE